MLSEPQGLAQLAEHWSGQAAVSRSLDDITRRSHFAWLNDVRGSDEAPAMAATQSALGSPSAWGPAFKRYAQRHVPRVVVVPTWQCELRCRYCTIPKQDGRVMDAQTLERSIQLLLSADSQELELHFFGGEPFMEWDGVRHALLYGESLGAKVQQANLGAGVADLDRLGIAAA